MKYKPFLHGLRRLIHGSEICPLAKVLPWNAQTLINKLLCPILDIINDIMDQEEVKITMKCIGWWLWRWWWWGVDRLLWPWWRRTEDKTKRMALECSPLGITNRSRPKLSGIPLKDFEKIEWPRSKAKQTPNSRMRPKYRWFPCEHRLIPCAPRTIIGWSSQENQLFSTLENETSRHLQIAMSAIQVNMLYLGW